MARGRRWLKRRLLPALVVARFLTGSRLPTYTASGFLRVPFAHFAAITAGAGIVWTAAMFTIVGLFGVAALDQLGPWTWVIAAGLLIALLAGQRLFVSGSNV